MRAYVLQKKEGKKEFYSSAYNKSYGPLNRARLFSSKKSAKEFSEAYEKVIPIEIEEVK